MSKTKSDANRDPILKGKRLRKLLRHRHIDNYIKDRHDEEDAMNIIGDAYNEWRKFGR